MLFKLRARGPVSICRRTCTAHVYIFIELSAKQNGMMQPICKNKPKSLSTEVLNPLKKNIVHYDCFYTYPLGHLEKLILLLDCSKHASTPPEKNSLQLPWKLSEMKPAALIPVAIFSLPPTSTEQ